MQSLRSAGLDSEEPVLGTRRKQLPSVESLSQSKSLPSGENDNVPVSGNRRVSAVQSGHRELANWAPKINV
ncbi:hypothetical protein EYF80_035069 [Liparis tanakae]|uniref:Uncharacterized protein n=1 Tax=Liparis tanakae TaxID=230148 RepID=A0A4Z2GMI3_9TELE|nr:hypothetical protein EYF80_035069 [Liparis tanakae]